MAKAAATPAAGKAAAKPPGKAPAKGAAKPSAKPSGKRSGAVMPSHDPDYEYYEEEEEEEEAPPQRARPVGPVRGSPRPVPGGPQKAAPAPPAKKPVRDDDDAGPRTGQSGFSPRAAGGMAQSPGVRPTQPARAPIRELAPPPMGVGGDKVPPELTKLFSLVGKFQPQPLELQPHFKPFLPELQVAIGNIDAFIKVPRPDGEPDQLGLKILDEPTIGSANPQILKMQLREKFGVIGGNESDGFIGCIDVDASLQKSLTNFLESYDEIARSRAAPSITYSSAMPEIGDLMEPWTAELQEAIESCRFPSPDLEMSLEEYARFVCAMLDIPVRGNVVESCHVLFALFQRFKEIAFFGTDSQRETLHL